MDDLSFLSSAPGALLISVALMLLCVPLRMTPRIPRWTIPYICLFLGSVGYCILEGWSFKNHLIGFIIGGCAVGLHQSLKQGRIGIRGWLADDSEKADFPENKEHQ